MMKNQIEIYQAIDGQTQVEVTFDHDTVWLNRKQLAQLFGRDIKTIGKHINNVFDEEELDKDSVVANFATTAIDNKIYQVDHYNLDVIISVGYRVKSRQGTEFRQWATQRLKEYLVQGYVINEKRLAQKQQEVQTLKDGIRILSRAIEGKIEKTELDWLEHFAKGLELLDDYDHEQLDDKGLTKRSANYPESADYEKIIDVMRAEFNSTIFGKEKDGSFQSAIAQISKGFGEEDFYPSLEEKAATLLYLIVKNHGFVDGNKRIAAACFLLFLEKNNLLYTQNRKPIVSNEALASLTLFVATSKPDEMETVKKLIISVLNRNQ
ncbi:RhuM family protein [Galbibacter sp.]|jgi:prophage maintenance system killer protein|uniref:RhuM family protein n=1 Tax=Galbibacter sp. TaxID=2918471 RepID=UPI003A8E244E